MADGSIRTMPVVGMVRDQARGSVPPPMSGSPDRAHDRRLYPGQHGSRTTVRQAISTDRPGGQLARGVPWATRGEMWLSRLPRPLALSIRNTFRRRGRLLLTLFTLTMGGAIFIGVFNVRASMERYTEQLSQHFIADVTVTLERPYRVAQIKQVLAQVPGLREIEAWTGASAEVRDAADAPVEYLQIAAPPSDTVLLDPEILAGRWLEPGEKALVLSDAIWETLPDLEPGDTLRLSVNGRRTEDWPVAGIFSFTSLAGDPLAYADYDALSTYLDQPNQSASYRLVTGAPTLQDQLLAGRDVDRHLRALGYGVSDVEAGLVAQEQIKQLLSTVIVFLLAMALLTAFAGSIDLAGTMGMNVLERTREIGVMRAIGAMDRKVMQSVLVEGLVIGGISWALAWLLSFPISSLLLQIMSQTGLGASISLAPTLDGVAIWLVVVLVLSALASVLPARNAARLTIREVLAYE